MEREGTCLSTALAPLSGGGGTWVCLGTPVRTISQPTNPYPAWQPLAPRPPPIASS